MASIHELSAAELAASYSGGELSPVEATRALLERIDAWEPRLNAMYRIDRDGALRQARDAESRWRVQAPLSPLDGVPVTIKENIYTKGDPAPIGTAANLPAAPQGADAPPAARLREAGCVFLGKTTMPDYGMLSAGVSSAHGITRNPWNTAKNTSGSSSGAGAANLDAPYSCTTVPWFFRGLLAHRRRFGANRPSGSANCGSSAPHFEPRVLASPKQQPVTLPLVPLAACDRTSKPLLTVFARD